MRIEQKVQFGDDRRDSITCILPEYNNGIVLIEISELDTTVKRRLDKQKLIKFLRMIEAEDSNKSDTETS